jgi:hypothetical protein
VTALDAGFIALDAGFIALDAGLTALDAILGLDHPWYRDGNLSDYRRFAQWAAAAEPHLPLLSVEDHRCLPDDRRVRYDQRRIWHNSHLPLVTTPLIERVRAEMDQRLAYNQSVDDGRKHVIIDGEGGLGKSSAARDYARRAYRHYAQDDCESPVVPVVWIKVPAAQGVEPLLDAIARFVGYPFKARTVGRQALLVADYIAKCDTQLMVLDDAHRLHEQRRSKDSTINLLKWFSDTAGIGYLITAVDLRSKGWYQDSVNDTQWWERVFVIEVRRNLGADTIEAFETRLMLLKHRPGTLATKELSKRLYRRTEGRIGRLAELLGNAARTAILDGSERINAELLEHTTTSGVNHILPAGDREGTVGPGGPA